MAKGVPWLQLGNSDSPPRGSGSGHWVWPIFRGQGRPNCFGPLQRHLVETRHRPRRYPQPPRRKITFAELADAALEYAKANKLSYDDDVIRMKPMREAFGNRTAESITSQDIERWLLSHETWKPATANRYTALFSLVYGLGIDNNKVSTNPVKQVRKRRENNGRERYLTGSEEQTLREQISNRCPQHLPEFEIALHTGMRRGEQFGCEWTWVNLERRVLTIPRSKHGEKRRVYLNDIAVAAFRVLWRFSKGSGRVFGHLYQSD